jgi:hypothetical protein
MFSFILKAIALALAIAAFVLGLLGNTEVDTLIALLSVGLLALALEGFIKRR